MGPKRKLDASKLASIVELTRVRLAAAQGKYESAKEALRLAKRRQKEAKLIVRRAKKVRKQAKVELGEILRLYTAAESKFAKFKVDKLQAEKAARQKQESTRDGSSAPAKSLALLVGDGLRAKSGAGSRKAMIRGRHTGGTSADGSANASAPHRSAAGASLLANSRIERKMD